MSRSGFYDWLGRTPIQRSRSDERLAVELRASYARHRGKYARPRLTVDLREAGFRVNHKRVRRLMLREGLRARRPQRLVRTTDSWHSFVPAPKVDNALRRHHWRPSNGDSSSSLFRSAIRRRSPAFRLAGSWAPENSVTV